MKNTVLLVSNSLKDIRSLFEKEDVPIHSNLLVAHVVDENNVDVLDIYKPKPDMKLK